MEAKKPINHIVAGLLIAGILIVFSIIMSLVSGTSSNPGSGWLSYLVIIAGLSLFIYLYGKAMNNTVGFGDLFAYGFKSTAVIVVVFVIFMIILSFAFPEFKEKAMDAARQEMERQGRLNDSDIEKGIELVNKYFWVFAIGGTVLAFVIVGAIGSLIGAAITPKKPKNPFEQQSV
jgi:NADH:ubiquinone oxidoreductase subunit 6 (subunit J)